MKNLTAAIVCFGLFTLFSCDMFSVDPTAQAVDRIATADALIQQGLEAKAAGDILASLEFFTQAYITDPDYARACIERGNLLLEAFSDYDLGIDQAIIDYSNAIQNDPENEIAYANRAVAYILLEDYSAALVDLNRAIELDPNFAVAYRNRGYAYLRLDQPGEAFIDLDKSIQIEATAEAYYFRGYVYYYQYDYIRAIQDFEDAVEIDPFLVEAYIPLANITATQLGQLPAAISIMDQAIATNPNEAMLYANRGHLYNLAREYHLAINNFDFALSLHPNSPCTLIGRGNAQYGRRQYELALRDYSSAFSLNPKLHDALRNIALTQHLLGDYYSAAKSFSTLIERYPDNPEYYVYRGVAYQDLLENPLAEADFSTALELTGSKVEFLNIRAIYYKHLEKKPRMLAALDDINAAIELDPNSAFSYYIRASILASLGQVEPAMADYYHILEISDDPVLRQRARNRILFFGRDPKVAYASPTPTIIPTATSVPLPRQVFDLGLSPGGYALEIVRIGDGGRAIVLASSLSGAQDNVGYFLSDIIGNFNADRLPEDFTLYIFPFVNPDGVVARTNLNLNGVDLSRNWDTPNWQANTQNPTGVIVGGGGSAPFSEFETDAFSTWLLELQSASPYPTTVIFYSVNSQSKRVVWPSYSLEGEIPVSDPIASRYGQAFAIAVDAEFFTVSDDYYVTGDPLLWCGENGFLCLRIELPSLDYHEHEDSRIHAAALDALIKSLLSN